jgi:hypothetical protein
MKVFAKPLLLAALFPMALASPVSSKKSTGAKNLLVL